MFKLERLLFITCVLVLNLGGVSSTIAEFFQLLKTVEENTIECVHTINRSGLYSFKPDLTLPVSECEITVEVPKGSMVYVRPSERTCETTSSANISTMCDRPHQEEQLGAGRHHFLFDAAESVTISILITPIIRLECSEWARNLHDVVGATIVLENNMNNKYCMVQLPPSVEITWVNFESISRKKPCCPDVFIASADLEQTPISYSPTYSACDLRTTRPSVITRCESTFMYLRHSAQFDRIMFRIQARHKTNMIKCVPGPVEVEPDDFVCYRKPKVSKKVKQNFIL